MVFCKIPDGSVLEEVDDNRAEIGMRIIELRNNLIDVEKETGLNLIYQKAGIMLRLRLAKNNKFQVHWYNFIPK